MPVGIAETGRGRVGFLHYYRYHYRYEDVRLRGKPVAWERVDDTYTLQNGVVTADDAGASQSDHYLLNDADVEDCDLEWTMTRLTDRGREDRAWLVYRTHPRHPAHRSSFLLTAHCPEVNRAYRFRLEVRGGRPELIRDGHSVATQPTHYNPVPDWQWLIHDLPSESSIDPSQLRLTEGTFANSGQYRNGCSLFPSSGVAVLREVGGDFTRQPAATAASVSYGPYGGGHGHPDKLNLVVYAQGRQWLSDFGSMPYETNWKAEWTAHTISHNTVVIDGVSQRPAGRRNLQWPVDRATERVAGRLEAFEPETKAVRVSCDTAYEGFTLRRAVRLCGPCVVDDFHVAPTGAEAAKHTFDYVLHVDGELVDSTLPLQPRSGPLGEACGYQHVQQKQGGTSGDVMCLRFVAGKRQLRLWGVPVDRTPAEVIVADGPTNAPNARQPIVIVRRSAASARFVTVLEPVPDDAGLRAVRLTVETGRLSLVLDRASGSERIELR
jgi:hypothetical protein